MSTLKTGLLGLNKTTSQMLDTLSGIENYELIAIADRDSELVEKTAKTYQCSGYDDYRLFITENKFNCLIIAIGIHRCYEYIKLAMDKGFNILKMPPAARNFEETRELVDIADKNNITFAIANTARVRRSFQDLAEFLKNVEAPDKHLLTATCYSAANEYPKWQNDPKLAGGGALLYDCYQIIDQILGNFGLPQQIFSLSTSLAGDRQQRLYTTEDLAVTTMKYSDTLFCNLVTGRTLGPNRSEICVYTKDNILTADPDTFIISDNSGKVLEKRSLKQTYEDCLVLLLNNFAESILDPENVKCISSARQDLRNMALIQAAYLSARTAMPEQPESICRIV